MQVREDFELLESHFVELDPLEDGFAGVFLAYASPRGWAFIDRALYLPEEWSEDARRRQAAGVPEEVGYATKGELARAMLSRLRSGRARSLGERW